jgi:hypothetical protein
MQNSSTMRILEFKKSRVFIFFQKLRVAFNVLKSHKSIVIIDDQIESFRHEAESVSNICRDIHLSFLIRKNQKESEIHDNLVYQATNTLVHN